MSIFCAKNILIITIFLCLTRVYAQDTLYYNMDWKECTKVDARYMRLISKQLNKYAVTDYYYPSLKIQMVGSYSELNKQKEIENGMFRYFSNEGNLTSEGIFIEGKKVGTWKYYSGNGILWYSKTFKNDKEDGDAYTYYSSGSKRRKEAYKNGNILKGICYTPEGKDTAYYPMEEMPEFKGGTDELYKFISHTIKYPAIAREKKIEGKVIVQFIIEPSGKINKTEIISSPHYSLTTETLRLMSLMPAWKPGMIEGVRVPVKFTLPVKFQLD